MVKELPPPPRRGEKNVLEILGSQAILKSKAISIPSLGEKKVVTISVFLFEDISPNILTMIVNILKGNIVKMIFKPKELI